MKTLVPLLLVLSLVVCSSALPQGGSGDPEPVGNTECPTCNDPIQTPPEGLGIAGCSIDLAGAIDNGIGGASGVICMVCDEPSMIAGQQCPRKVKHDGDLVNVLIRTITIGGITYICVGATFHGEYDVDCETC